jgi:hypothetical protein
VIEQQTPSSVVKGERLAGACNSPVSRSRRYPTRYISDVLQKEEMSDFTDYLPASDFTR